MMSISEGQPINTTCRNSHSCLYYGYLISHRQVNTGIAEYNTITFSNFDALTEEYVHIWIQDNPDRQEDIFIENNFEMFCK